MAGQLLPDELVISAKERGPVAADAAPLRFAYADPPYLGLCDAYEHFHGDGGCWDELSTHAALVQRLCDEFSDGWAMSLGSKQLKAILTVCPDDVRIGAWVKPWSSFKKGVNPSWSWEPVIFRGGRRRTDGTEVTCRDFLACSSALRRGFFGAKPEKFCSWICDLLGYRHGVDELVDLFPGSGVMGRVLDQGRLV